MSYRDELKADYSRGGQNWDLNQWLNHIEDGNLSHADVMGLLAERDALSEKANQLESLQSDPQYSYAGFPISRQAIICRNEEIDQLRDRLDKVTNRAVRNVMDERTRQDKKWGEQNHDPYTYLAILLEEVGEYSQACLQSQFGGDKGGFSKMRGEAVQVAAVALAIVECLDRGKWSWPNPHKESNA
jgi:NTP pyrophosphatase (non-canonical NTP hydrolase)